MPKGLQVPWPPQVDQSEQKVVQAGDAVDGAGKKPSAQRSQLSPPQPLWHTQSPSPVRPSRQKWVPGEVQVHCWWHSVRKAAPSGITKSQSGNAGRLRYHPRRSARAASQQATGPPYQPGSQSQSPTSVQAPWPLHVASEHRVEHGGIDGGIELVLSSTFGRPSPVQRVQPSPSHRSLHRQVPCGPQMPFKWQVVPKSHCTSQAPSG
mmetsp:Transcript_74387/g.177485  ORF Transcript_74387/g.177485 Transcript_74387/m.177485 type:complete len:207 (-) Transcript_74387:231-851(-)